MDELVVEGNIYLQGGFQEACIGITDGKITSIKKILEGDRKERFPHSIILPSGIDIHVHFREPGFTYKEDFSTGSRAAAYGGISCFFDMPNTKPSTTTVDRLLEKKELASRHSFIDFGLYAGINENSIDMLPRLGRICSGFKVYLGETTSSLVLPIAFLQQAMRMIERTGKPVLFHAEDETCLQRYKRRESSLRDHLSSRPSTCEKEAIRRVLSIPMKSSIHFCHISSAESVDLLKDQPENISYGITPHHSLLNIDKTLKPESWFKVNPPLRTRSDQERLYSALYNGEAYVLESDHAPHLLDEKEMDFNDVPSGIPGVETMYPLFLYLSRVDRIPLRRVIQLLCEHPAEIMDIPKGSIRVGYDADFIVVNYRDTRVIKSEDMHSKCGWTPFDGFHAIFPRYLFVRGEPIIYNGEFIGERGFGLFVESNTDNFK